MEYTTAADGTPIEAKANFEWSELDELEGDPERNILLNEFKNDLEHVDKMEDLEQGMLPRGASNRVGPTPSLSADDQLLAKRQPDQHENNKTFFDRLCACCTENQDLNKRECRYYRKFAQTMQSPYSRDDP